MMFGNSPSRKDFDELKRIVDSQSNMIEAQNESIQSLRNLISAQSEYLSNSFSQIEGIANLNCKNVENLHIVNVFLAALVAELCARDIDPFLSIAGVHKRLKYVAGDMALEGFEDSQNIKNIIEFIVSYSSGYLRKGVQNGLPNNAPDQ